MTCGVLVLIVGPSGAGKDALINAARTALANESDFIFPRRIVTRAASAFEEHDSLDAGQFRKAAAAGHFALCWEAHGLSYGLPIAIDAAMAAGRVVICNVSRAAISQARSRFERVKVISVEANAAVRAQRIAARGRDLPTGSRLDPRRYDDTAPECDVSINNSGALSAAIAHFVAALRAIHAARAG